MDKQFKKYKTSKVKSYFLIFFYFFLVFSPLLAPVFYPSEAHEFFSKMGKAFSMMAIMILSLQFVIAGRFQCITAPYGHDAVMRFHRLMGIFAFVLLLLHPLLLSLDSIELLTKIQQPWFIQAGRIALVVIVILVMSTLFRKKLKISYERWRRLHDFLALLLLVLAYVHSGYAGSSFEDTASRVVWFTFPVVIFLIFIYYRVIRSNFTNKNLFTVKSVKDVTKDVIALSLARKDGHDIHDYLPGQFHFLTFKNGKMPSEEHHFTISSCPTEKKYIESTIKKSGDFTSNLHNARCGDEVVLSSAYGRFSYVLYPESNNHVFIAGGVGITPFISMLRHMQDTQSKCNVTLLYANRRVKDIAYFEELASIEEGENFNLKVIHILSEPDNNWKNEISRIDINSIISVCNEDLSDKAFWICGPEKMRNGLIKGLRAKSVKSEKIHAESFDLLGGSTPNDSRGIKIKIIAFVCIILWVLFSVFISNYKPTQTNQHGTGHSHSH